MKTRIGFISNSSSTSFLIFRKRPDLTQEERNNINRKQLEDTHGKGYIEDCEIDLNMYGENVIIACASISSDGDTNSDIERLIKRLIKGIGMNEKDFTVDIGD